MSRSGLNASIILPFIKLVDLAVCHWVLSQPRSIILYHLVRSCGQQNSSNAAKSVPSTHNPFHYSIFFCFFKGKKINAHFRVVMKAQLETTQRTEAQLDR